MSEPPDNIRVSVPPKVFCSYSPADREIVWEFATWLRENGVDAWLDLWEIQPGESFIAKVEQGLRNAEIIFLFLSHRSMDHVWQRVEIEAAIVRMVEKNIRVVPVLLDADTSLSPLLLSQSPRRLEEREALLESIHNRSHKPTLGPPPELWKWQARRTIHEHLARANEHGTLSTSGTIAIENALTQVLGERLQWVEESETSLASIAISLDEIDDVRLPFEYLHSPTGSSCALVRYEISGTETEPEQPSPRPEGGRIVLAAAEVPDGPVLEVMQRACRAGLHHVADATSNHGRRKLDECGAFDPDHDHIRSTSLRDLVRALRPREHRPGTAVLFLIFHVHPDGLCLCDEEGAPVVVSAEELATTMEPFAPTLRLLVLLPVVHEKVRTEWSNVPVDAALALHRRGFASVVAPRVPLPLEALPRVVSVLLRRLLGDPQRCPVSLEAALNSVCSSLRGLRQFPRLDLRLYARSADGHDTRPLVIVPYQGLSAFEPEHARFYLGREPEAKAVLARLADLTERGVPRLVILIGASGVGKSSLAKAGVLPRLAARGGWVPIITRPASDDLRQIEAPSRSKENGRRIVIIDQLEEIYTEAGIEGAGSYLRRIWTLAQDRLGTVVIATLRVEALGLFGEVIVETDSALTLERLASGSHALYVYHLGPEQIRTIITEPARHVGLHLDEGLVDRLRDEAISEPGALPMLEVALRHLWSERQGRRLAASSYRHGLAGTLGRQANLCVQHMPPDQLKQARRILVRIATGPDVEISTWRRRSTIRALRPDRGERRTAFDSALEELVRGRVVVTGEARTNHGTRTRSTREPSEVPIELAHELLLRRWATLRTWINEDRPKLHAVRKLEAWVEDWEQHPKTRLSKEQMSYIKNAGLIEDEDYINSKMRHLLNESERAAKRSDRAQQGVIAGLILASIALGISSYVAITQRNKAIQEAKSAESQRIAAEREREAADTAKHAERRARKRAESLRREAIADAKLAKSENNDALAWLEDTKPSIENWRRAREAIDGGTSWVLSSPTPTESKSLAWSPQGDTLAIAGAPSGDIELWRIETGQKSILPGHKNVTTDIVWITNRTLASASQDGTIRLWNTEKQRQTDTTNINNSAHSATYNTPNNILTIGTNNGLDHFHLKDGSITHLATEDHGFPIIDNAWSPDGNFLAVAIGEGSNTVNVADYRHTPPEVRFHDQHGGRVTNVQWSPDSTSLASSSIDGTVNIWNVEPDTHTSIDNPSGGIRTFTWSPTGSTIATSGAHTFGPLETSSNRQQNLDITIFSTKPSGLTRTLHGHNSYVTSLDWSPDGHFLASSDALSTHIWDLRKHDHRPVHIEAPGWLFRVEPLNREEILVTSGHSLSLWRWRTGERLAHWSSSSGKFFGTISRRSPNGDAIALSTAFPPQLGGQASLHLGYDPGIRIFDTKLKQIKAINTRGEVGAIQWTPDGAWISALVIGHPNLALFSISGESREIAMEGWTPTYHDAMWISWPTTSDRVLISVDGTTAFVIDTKTGEKTTLDGYIDGTGGGARWSHDGRFIAAPGEAGIISVFDGSNYRKIKTLHGHEGPVLDLAWSPTSNEFLATCDEWHNLIIWNVSSGQFVSLPFEETVHSISWSLDGSTMFAATTNDTIYAVAVPLERDRWGSYMEQWGKNRRVLPAGTVKIGEFSGISKN